MQHCSKAMHGILLVSVLALAQSQAATKGPELPAPSPPSTWNEVEPLASALTGTEDASSVQGFLGSTPIGTDAAAEAVSDSIRSLFGLPRERLPLLVPMPATAVPVVAEQVMSSIAAAKPAAAVLGGVAKQPVALVAKVSEPTGSHQSPVVPASATATARKAPALAKPASSISPPPPAGLTKAMTKSIMTTVAAKSAAAPRSPVKAVTPSAASPKAMTKPVMPIVAAKSAAAPQSPMKAVKPSAASPKAMTKPVMPTVAAKSAAAPQSPMKAVTPSAASPKAMTKPALPTVAAKAAAAPKAPMKAVTPSAASAKVPLKSAVPRITAKAAPAQALEASRKPAKPAAAPRKVARAFRPEPKKTAPLAKASSPAVAKQVFASREEELQAERAFLRRPLPRAVRIKASNAPQEKISVPAAASSSPNTDKMQPETLTMTLVPLHGIPAPVVQQETQVLTMTMWPQSSSFSARLPPTQPGTLASGFAWLRSCINAIVYGETAQVSAPKPTLQLNQVRAAKQDVGHTADAAAEDSLAELDIHDPWAEQEKADDAVVEYVKREDRALRAYAQMPKQRPTSPSFTKNDAGSTHISGYWAKLEGEDDQISLALKQGGEDDLTEYARLVDMQDAKVAAAVGEISGPAGERLQVDARSEALLSMNRS